MKILRRDDVLTMIGLSRSTLYNMVRSGRFPSPTLIGQRAVGWREAEVNDWLAARPAASRKP
ncbi:MAG: hypothetical protein RI988_2962 [Pseudomonadota bacterium]|jgi:prophage regulatory protein